MRLGRKARTIIVLIGLIAGMVTAMANAPFPALDVRDGDLVFQTSESDQALAILLATRHPFLHTGIVKLTPEGPVVIEAVRKVQETPLKEWFERGILRRMAVYRYRDLTLGQEKAIIEAAKPYYGRGYDFYFLLGNDEVYCSELPYAVFNDLQLKLGTPQKIATLSLDNAPVRKIVEQRWQKHPLCQDEGMTFDRCYKTILDQELVTPRSLSEDPKLKQIFSNYYWW